MAGRNSHINRFLIFISVFLCLICGLLFTQSSADPSGNNPVSIAVKDTQIIPEITDIPDQTDHTDISASVTAAPTATTVVTTVTAFTVVSTHFGHMPFRSTRSIGLLKQ